MDNIIVNFATFPFCFRTTNLKNFSNKLKNELEFSSKFKDIFEKLLPHISENTFNTLISEQFHCHLIRDNEQDKINLIYKVVGELVQKWQPGINVEEFLEQNLNGEKIWQLGNGSVRIIGVRKENIFNVLFIDYHHLIYPSIKYNEKEYSRNNYGIIEYCEVENE